MLENKPFKMTLDDGSTQEFPSGYVEIECSITHGTATRWIKLQLRDLRKHVRAETLCLIPPGIDLRHSISSIEPVPRSTLV